MYLDKPERDQTLPISSQEQEIVIRTIEEIKELDIGLTNSETAKAIVWSIDNMT